MFVKSDQGVWLTSVQEVVPTSGEGTTVTDGFDLAHHRLIWSVGSGVQVRTPRMSLLVHAPAGLWVPAECPFTVETDTPWWSARFVAGSCPPGWRRLVQVPLDTLVPTVLVDLAHHPSDPRSHALLSVAIDRLTDAFLGQSPTLRFPTDPRARDLADALVADPASPRELGEWAPRVGASERTLRRLFVEQTGMPFRTWRMQLRIQTAMRLLGDGITVGDVVRRCGYTSRSALDKAFSAQVGMSPAVYARRQTAPGLVDRRRRPVSRKDWPSERKSSGHPLVDFYDDLIEDDMTGWTRKMALLSAATLLVAAACGSDDDGDDEGTGDSATSTAVADSIPTEDDADAGDAASSYPRTIEHAAGSITLDARPETVVTLDGLRLLDALLSLDVRPVGAGVGAGDEFAAAIAQDAEGIQKLGDPFGDLNVEAIAELDPDVIFTFDWIDEQVLERVGEIAPLFVISSEDSQAWDTNLVRIAEVFAAEDVAAERIGEVEERIEAVAASVDDGTQISVIYPKDDGSFFAMQETYALVDQVIEPVGLDVELPAGIEGEPGGSLADVSAERLGDIESDHLFVLPLPGAEETIQQNPLWESLPQVQADEVTFGDASTWGNYGPIALLIVLDQLEAAIE
ncbi:MAG: AraC family transcriptional regulator [Actinomycetota bacterium]